MADESKAHTKSLNFTGRCFYSWRFSMFLPFPLCRASPPHTAHPPNYDGVPGLENRCGPCGPQENWGRPVLFES